MEFVEIRKLLQACLLARMRIYTHWLELGIEQDAKSGRVSSITRTLADYWSTERGKTRYGRSRSRTSVKVCEQQCIWVCDPTKWLRRKRDRNIPVWARAADREGRCGQKASRKSRLWRWRSCGRKGRNASEAYDGPHRQQGEKMKEQGPFKVLVVGFYYSS